MKTSTPTVRTNWVAFFRQSTEALVTWQSHQATIFNGAHVWSGDASKAAGAAVEGATKAMQDHRQQLRDAIAWCNDAATNIVDAKDTITSNVTAGQQEIQSIEKMLQRQIRTLTVQSGLLSNGSTARMSPRSMLLRWAWAASPTCRIVQLTSQQTDPGAHGRTQSPETECAAHSHKSACWVADCQRSGRDAAIPPVPPPQSRTRRLGLRLAPARSGPGRAGRSTSAAQATGRLGPALSVATDLRQHRQRFRASTPGPSIVEPPAAAPRSRRSRSRAVRAKLGRRTFGFAGHKQPQLALVITVGRRHKLCRQPVGALGLRRHWRTRRRRR